MGKTGFVSVIIPVYNEEDTILEVIRRVKAVDIYKEILVVDDGSTDGTTSKLLSLNGDGEVHLFSHPLRQGKGSAIRTALQHARGDLVIIQDADLEYDPQDYIEMVNLIRQKGASVIYGSRLLDSKNQKSYLRYFLGGKIITWLTNLLYGCSLTDESTCYKLFRTDVLKSLELQCKGFEFCPEVTAKIRKKGIEIREVPISYTPRKFEEGKKIKWRDGLQAIWTLLKYRYEK